MRGSDGEKGTGGRRITQEDSRGHTMIHKDAGTGRIRETGVEGMCKELRWERRVKATMEGNNVRLEGGEGNADIMEEGRGECDKCW